MLKRASHTSIIVRVNDDNLIPEFDPDKDSVTIEDWVKKTSRLASRYGWDDDCIMRLISSRLKGNARLWYDEQSHYDMSWDEVQRALID